MLTTRPPESGKASTSPRRLSRAVTSADLLPMRITARARCARISATYSRSPELVGGRAGQAHEQLPGVGDLDEPGGDGGKVRILDVVDEDADMLLRPVATALAWRLAVYPSSATAQVDAVGQLRPTRRGPSLTTLDAVVSDTPARSATSCSVTRARPSWPRGAASGAPGRTRAVTAPAAPVAVRRVSIASCVSNCPPVSRRVPVRVHPLGRELTRFPTKPSLGKALSPTRMNTPLNVTAVRVTHAA